MINQEIINYVTNHVFFLPVKVGWSISSCNNTSEVVHVLVKEEFLNTTKWQLWCRYFKVILPIYERSARSYVR